MRSDEKWELLRPRRLNYVNNQLRARFDITHLVGNIDDDDETVILRAGLKGYCAIDIYCNNIEWNQ